MSRDQRDHSVAAKPKPVHPMGQPISASTNSGLSVRASAQVFGPSVGVGRAGREWKAPACSDKGRLFFASVAGPARTERWSRAVGVAHCRDRSWRLSSRCRPALHFSPSPARGVGHRRSISVRLPPLDRVPEQARGVGQRVASIPVGEDKQPLAPMGRADFRRRKQSRRKAVAHADQVSGDLGKSEAEMMGDVLQEHEWRLALADDPGDVGPQMARVLGAPPPSGNRERLARIARKHDVHRATPRVAVEGDKVVPDRSRIQGRVLHPGHEDGRGIGFPLDVTHSAIPGRGDGKAEIEPAGAGAQRKSEHALSCPTARTRGGM